MKLEIKEPCHEDWNNMKIGVKSRHCEVCVKSVMDFTTSSRAEIITYILTNPNESVCGRLRKDQFDFQHEDVPVLVNVLKSQPRNHAFLILALVSISLSACAQEPPQAIQTPPAIHNEFTVGKIAQPVDTTKNVQCTAETPTKGEIMILGEIEPHPVIQGAMVAEPIEPVNNGVLQFSEKMPEYSGGMDALFTYINDYFASKKITEKGNVYVRFIVKSNGEIVSPEIMRIPSNLGFLKDEIIRMVERMPKWIPGENNGKKVDVYYTIPVRFQ